MKSTGEVMGIGKTFGEAFDKAQKGAGMTLPASGRIFVSVKDADKDAIVKLFDSVDFVKFEIIATKGTARALINSGIACIEINKVMQGQPHIVDAIKNGEIDLIINTTEGKAQLRIPTLLELMLWLRRSPTLRPLLEPLRQSWLLRNQTSKLF